MSDRIKVRVYYPDRGDRRARGPYVTSYTRVPSVGEIVEAPAPLAPERTSLWEVRRVVHHQRPDPEGVDATISVEMEGEELAERVASRVVALQQDVLGVTGKKGR